MKNDTKMAIPNLAIFGHENQATDAFKTPPRPPKTFPRRPKTPSRRLQDAPKALSRRLQDAFKRPLERPEATKDAIMRTQDAPKTP